MRQRTSRIFDEAELRANGIQTINPNLELGSDLTLSKFKQLITDGRDKLTEYNQALILANQKANEVDAAEKIVREYSSRMLAGVAAVFGKDSSQYEQSGGTRTSERRKTTRKTDSKPS